MRIREIRLDDCDSFSLLMEQVENNAEFLLYEPGERIVSPKQQELRIKTLIQSRNSTILVAEEDRKLVGYVFAIGGDANRNKHSVYLVIGIHPKFRGEGIGKLLLNKVENWAIRRQVSRIELTVVTQNEPAIALYKKMGFEVEGVKRRSLQINGKFVDEFYMSKLL